MRLGMMIELDRCIGCRACVSACKERWDSGPGARRDWVYEYEHGARGKDLGITFFPGLCNHCDDHPCTTDCPTGATWATAEGVVVVDPDVCIGCGNCVSTCPYGARTADPVKGIVEKCNLCAPYIAQGKQPACVETCLAECRHVGDLDDPKSKVSQLIAARGAKPLTTPQVQIGPRVYYAPEAARQQVLAHYEIEPPRSTALTQLWQRSRPVARHFVPAVALGSLVFGLLVNLRMRRAEPPGDEPEPEPPDRPTELPRHRLGMRLLHWFNLASWLLLLSTGTALMVTPTFALFGSDLARTVSNLLGGTAATIRLHVVWGLLWALIIVPVFLYQKRGGLEALREIRPTRDDLRWMVRKPLVMLGLTDRELPAQGKYNAGQKAFAATALAGTTLIIATGVVMTLHLGPPPVIRAAIFVHKMAVLLALVGLAVHVMMAAVIKDERPALRSMITGKVDRAHALHHSAHWVEELEEHK